MSSYDYYASPQHAPPPSRQHSRLGIASFVIGLLVGFLEFVLVIIAGFLEASNPGGMNEQSVQAVVLGLGILGGLALTLLGIVLGIAGLFEHNRNKIFAVLGLVICSLIIVGVGLLMAIGLMAQRG